MGILKKLLKVFEAIMCDLQRTITRYSFINDYKTKRHRKITMPLNLLGDSFSKTRGPAHS